MIPLRRIGSESEPRNFATETDTGCDLFQAANPPSPVRLCPGPHPKPRVYTGFWGAITFPASKSPMTQTQWRRERDSNPRYLAVHTLSKRAPSTTRPSLRKFFNFFVERRRAARPGCAHAPSQSRRPAESITGGEGGIRTLDRRLTYTPLAGARFQPAQPPLRGRGTISYRRAGAGSRGPEFQGKSPLRFRKGPPNGPRHS